MSWPTSWSSALALWRAPKDRVMGMNRRNVSGILPRNARRDYPIADDKLLCKRLLAEAGVPVAPTLRHFEHFGEIAKLKEQLADLAEFVVKPARGSGGRGILVIAKREVDRYQTAGGRWVDFDQLRKHVADIVYGVYSLDKGDVAFVEPRLKPAPFFEGLFARGLSDVRVIVVENQPVLAMLRVPTVDSDGRANLHQGALGLGVRLADGLVHRGWHRGRTTEGHPDHGARGVGAGVPDWDAIVAVARAAAAAVPLKYLGIDIVVDRTLGPLVLEINARPGLEIQNVTGTPLRARLAELGLHS